MKTFEEMEVWKLARELTRNIYDLTKTGSFAKDFRLGDQIRSASFSIMSNIAEGSERDGNAEFLQFLSIAKGSAAEVKSHLYVAFDQHYIDDARLKELFSATSQIGRQLGALIKYIRLSGMKGRKFAPIVNPSESRIRNSESQ